MILDVVLAKVFAALAIVSVIFCGAAALDGSADKFVYGLCGIVLFSNLAAKYFKNCLRY